MVSGTICCMSIVSVDTSPVVNVVLVVDVAVVDVLEMVVLIEVVLLVVVYVVDVVRGSNEIL